MKVWYDTEFLEDGKTIDLISIGMVREDGAELYYVNRDAPWKRIKKHEWLMANVVPKLPQPHGDWILHMPKSWPIDFYNPAVKPKDRIADAVRRFLLGPIGEPELWAWYGAYDHVVLAQLFGRMIDLPTGVPMWTNDLRQEVHRLGNPAMPEQPAGVHNALEDARHLRVMHEHLTAPTEKVSTLTTEPNVRPGQVWADGWPAIRPAAPPTPTPLSVTEKE